MLEFYGKPLTFDERTHRYQWGGNPVPGVTTILSRMAKPALIQWAANMAVQHVREVASFDHEAGLYTVNAEQLEAARVAHARVKSDAADIGKEVHLYAERILSGRPFDVPKSEAEANGRTAFDAWAKEHDVEPIDLERRVYSQQHNYAGTTDFYGLIDGRPAILDFKTSSGIWPEYWLQTSAYELALREELQTDKPMDRWIIRLDETTGKFEAQRREFDIDHTTAWIQMVRLNAVLTRIEAAAKPARRRAA